MTLKMIYYDQVRMTVEFILDISMIKKKTHNWL